MSGDARVRTLLSDALGGARLSEEDAAYLLGVKDRDIWRIAEAADEKRADIAGETISYVRNQNINVTNICINSCGFCGFSRKAGAPDAYFFGEEELREKVRLARERDVTEICSVSGLHPDFNAGSYTSLIRFFRREAPGVHIHAGTPMEVAYAARRSGITTREVLTGLQEAGLGSLCGTAAEVLVDQVRERICPGKIRTGEWIRIIREAHGLGIPTTATILYGVGESVQERARHLAILRDIQEETGGFTEFVPLSFIHQRTPLFLRGEAPAGATGREDLLLYAVSRLFLDNVRNIQASWVKMGTRGAQVALAAGANDLGGTLFEERISRDAGADNTDYLAPDEMERIATDLGRPLHQRTTLYAMV